MTSIDDARAWKEAQSVSTPIDLLNAAKWGNPRLVRFVHQNKDRALSALRVIDMTKPKADLAKAATLDLIARRVLAALRAEPPLDLPQIEPVLTDGETAALAERIGVYAQGVLDTYKTSDYYMPERHVILEGILFAELIQPLVSSGTLKDGRIAVGLGNHPKTGAHHSLVVGSVKLESAAKA